MSYFPWDLNGSLKVSKGGTTKLKKGLGSSVKSPAKAAMAGVDTLDMAALKRLSGFEFYRGESPKRVMNVRMAFLQQ